jgi:peptidoglycan/LPS O-acetylase OafA/YrhL
LALHNIANNFGIDLLKISSSVAVAAFSYRYVERPILRFKDLFPYVGTARSSSALAGGINQVGAVEAG